MVIMKMAIRSSITKPLLTLFVILIKTHWNWLMNFWSQKRQERGNFLFPAHHLTQEDQYIQLLMKALKTQKLEKDM